MKRSLNYYTIEDFAFAKDMVASFVTIAIYSS